MRYAIAFVTILFLLGCEEQGFQSTARSTGPVFKSAAVKPHTANTTTPEFLSSSATSTWYITGTELDSSLVNSLGSGAVTFKFTCDDTSASNDSVAIKFVIWVADAHTPFSSMTLADFARRDSVTVVSEKPVYKILRTRSTTDEPFLPYTWVTAEGTVANAAITAVSVESSVTWTN